MACASTPKPPSSEGLNHALSHVSKLRQPKLPCSVKSMAMEKISGETRLPAEAGGTLPRRPHCGLRVPFSRATP